MIRLLFLCLARDCETTIPTFVSYLNLLECHGFSCAAIIGENGSRDQTRALIQAAADANVELLDTSVMAAEQDRLRRMAVGRQALFERAAQRQQEYDYVCVADLDNAILAPPDPASVKSAIERLRADGTLFAVGATSYPVYYDLLSLQATGHDYSHLHSEIQAAQKTPFLYFRFHRERIYENQRLVTECVPMRCLSSFNGFCIYNAQDYRLGTYRDPDEATSCEHVTFHRSLAHATGKAMMVAPELSIRAPKDHIPVNALRFWVNRIAKKAALTRAS